MTGEKSVILEIFLRKCFGSCGWRELGVKEGGELWVLLSSAPGRTEWEECCTNKFVGGRTKYFGRLNLRCFFRYSEDIYCVHFTKRKNEAYRSKELAWYHLTDKWLIQDLNSGLVHARVCIIHHNATLYIRLKYSCFQKTMHLVFTS